MNGQQKEGKQEGFGKYISRNRIKYGVWENGNIEGNGVSQYSDGSVYKGKYVGGVKQGEGSYTWTNGQKFVGNWLNNELHGNGILIAGGNKYEVIYRFGKIFNKGIY